MGYPTDNFVYYCNHGATLFYIVTNKAAGGVLVDPTGIIVYTPPYYGYLRGKHVEKIGELVTCLHAIH